MANTTVRFLVAVISFIAVLFSVPVTAADKDVNVTNPVLNVQGNVTVGNTVPVQASSPLPIQGSVAVTSLPAIGGAVEVTNASSNPVPVEMVSAVDARTPYQETITQLWDTPAINIIFNDVPFGQRLVIEHISASLFLDPDQELGSLSITLATAGVSATHQIAIPESGPAFTGSTTYSGGQALRLYSDQAPFVRVTKLPSTPSIVAASATVTISGYLIPLTSPSLAP